MEYRYLDLFTKVREISSEDFLKEKKEINFFNVNEYSDDQAFMNFRMDGSLYNQFINMYEGYAEASLCLLEDCMKERYSPKKDIWMFPIFFDIIHSLELFLKATNWLLKRIESNFTEDFDITNGGHDIFGLSNEVSSRIEKSKTFDYFKNDFKLINEFIKKIADMFKVNTVDKDTFVAPRYPVTKDKIPYSYVEQNETIEGTDFLKDESFKIKMSNLRIWLLKVYQICEDFNMCIQDCPDIITQIN